MYKLESRDGKLYARKQKRGGGPLGALEEVDQDWVNSNKDSIFGFDNFQDSDDPMLRNAWTGSFNQGLTDKISNLEKQLSERSVQQLLDDPQYQENVQKRNPEATLDEPMTGSVTEAVSRQNPEQAEQPNLASPGMNELRAGRAIGSFGGKRDRGESIQESIQGDLFNSARRQIRGEDKKSKANERIQEIMDARERDLRESWNKSPYGAISHGKSFDDLDDKTKSEMRERYLKNRMAGAYNPSQPKAPTASQTQQNIPQEKFDNMSEADLERELTGVMGGAYEAPRIKLEDLTVPSEGPGRMAKIQRDLGLPAGPEQSLSWSAKEIARRDAEDRGESFDPNEFYEVQRELGLPAGPEQSPSFMANEVAKRMAKNSPQSTPQAPTVTPSPDDFQIEPQGTGYDRSRDRAFVESQVQRRAPDNLDMPYNVPQETTFETRVRPPQYDRAKDLSMVQNQTSLETPAMPKTEFMTRENNAPAPAPAPAAEAKRPTPRYIPRYGSQGFMGFNEGSANGRFIQAPQGQNQKTMLNNLLRQDKEDDENRKKYTNNNPFGTEFRPASRDYLGPVEKSPTPRTTAMMREYDQMPKGQQMGVINSFRKKRGEEELYNPFA